MTGRPVRLIAAGYFGCGNLGDDAILAGFLEGLAGERAQVTVLSGAPEATHRMHGTQAVARRNLSLVREAIAESDALVFPGGSVFQDSTSIRSVLYYASLVRIAKRAGKRVFLLGQGVGPLRSVFGKRWTRDAFRAADSVTVRDPESASTLTAIGYPTRPPVTADTALLLPAPSVADGDGGFGVGTMKAVGVALRPVKGHRELADVASELCRLLYSRGLMPVLIEMDAVEDRALIDRIEKAHGGKLPSIRRLPTPQTLQQRLARMEAVFAVRLHAGILAATAGAPPFFASYDPKVSAFATELGFPFASRLAGVPASKLFEDFARFVADAGEHREALARKLPELRERARMNLQPILDLLHA